MTYYAKFEDIPDDILFRADEYICKLLNVTVDDNECNEHTLDAVKWINGNIGIDEEYLQDQCEIALAIKGLIETEYTPKTWAKNNGVSITIKYSPRLNQRNRMIYSATIKVDDKVIDDNFGIGLGMGENIDDILYDSILSFLYYFSESQYDEPLEEYDGDEEYDNIKLARDFTNALSDTARDEFVNGAIEFRE